MRLNGKTVDLPQLQAELAAAGIVVPALGIANDDLHTYDDTGTSVDVPPAAAAVVAAHVPIPPPTHFMSTQVLVDRVTTVGTMPQELMRATLQPLTAYRARVEVFGVDRGNGNVRDVEAKVTAKRLNAGAILVPNASAAVVTVLADHRDGTAATWAIVPSVAGNDFVITAAGAAGRTVDWFARMTVDAFTPGGQ